MLRQRCLVQLTKQCISRQSLLKKNVNLTYCELQYRYNSDAKERKFTDRHEWVVVKEDIGTVGISNYAQESLGGRCFCTAA
ncbi:glycine cleavage system H protein [Danaus plexippus plexippus]|uniref:Glycine cleavage system H protein n=1 Tax=Danaus plexippus plexippus TaxID=278856 RepID=A0A212F832_DANPL|nr:glycine cleavage system H protein [Danaus plexippus plexippus]